LAQSQGGHPGALNTTTFFWDMLGSCRRYDFQTAVFYKMREPALWPLKIDPNFGFDGRGALEQGGNRTVSESITTAWPLLALPINRSPSTRFTLASTTFFISYCRSAARGG
jgi:hypothetical protein